MKLFKIIKDHEKLMSAGGYYVELYSKKTDNYPDLRNYEADGYAIATGAIIFDDKYKRYNSLSSLQTKKSYKRIKECLEEVTETIEKDANSNNNRNFSPKLRCHLSYKSFHKHLKWSFIS